MFHPLQAICDILTIKEHLDYTKNKLKVAWIGDANNVINDMAIACLKVGNWDWGEDKDKVDQMGMIDTCRRLQIEVYQLEDPETALQGWEEPQFPKYRGNHGLKISSSQE